jgi:hypothetical protein
MVAVTYDAVNVSAGKTSPQAAPAQTAAPRKAWYVRFMEALIESRMQQARREIARHIHLMPYALDERGNRLVRTDRQDAPFGGW